MNGRYVYEGEDVFMKRKMYTDQKIDGTIQNSI